MYGSELSCFSFWWIFPIFMMILCFFMMKGRWGSMMCGFNPSKFEYNQANGSESVIEILEKRYASGEIDKTEYEEKRNTLIGSADSVKR